MRAAESISAALLEYFGGDFTVTVPHEGYDDVVEIPGCSPAVVEEVVCQAVEQGFVWLRNGPTSVWKEEVPYGALDERAVLLRPLDELRPQELIEEALTRRLERRTGDRLGPLAGVVAGSGGAGAVGASSRGDRQRGA